MAGTAELQQRARLFAEELNTLLNGTVVHGPRLTTVTSRTGDRAWIGFGITPTELVPVRGMPLTISDAPPKSHLHVYHVMTLDEAGYLTTARSDAGLYVDPDLTRCLCRYDYERDKADYSEAHLHVYGETNAIEAAALSDPDAAKRLGDLHFPVSGRRFRPALEDLIDFTVTEGFAKAKPGYTAVLKQQRERFYRIQLRAAIRRNIDIAREAVAEFDR